MRHSPGPLPRRATADVYWGAHPRVRADAAKGGSLLVSRPVPPRGAARAGVLFAAFDAGR
ncbi:hypothetical protein ACF1B0_09305 [Streptomyces anandii]|uniref:hypothetical protein n=1 Tax=Streptomyces anandii TaxID=285454 RepID=UPI0036F8C984